MEIQKNEKNQAIRGMARGFSLFEMVIVMGIIGVILGGAIFAMRNIGDGARLTAVDGNFRALETNLDMYKLNGRRYPTQQQGLEALINKPTTSPIPKLWTQTIDDENVLFDPWGTKYKYVFPGSKDPSRPEIISAGKDTQFGTDDDLSNQN